MGRRLSVWSVPIIDSGHHWKHLLFGWIQVMACLLLSLYKITPMWSHSRTYVCYTQFWKLTKLTNIMRSRTMKWMESFSVTTKKTWIRNVQSTVSSTPCCSYMSSEFSTNRTSSVLLKDIAAYNSLTVRPSALLSSCGHFFQRYVIIGSLMVSKDDNCPHDVILESISGNNLLYLQNQATF